ncbi:GIY-YIG nuclease family protein [Zoogloea sp.]|uniref:GIY-YIG nuclease family protein n=1 Tax=Zoogloea sp. TaxID=49181 RepID=UPI0035AD918B
MNFTPGSQIVYVLTNPAMPGLVKIGKTTQAEVTTRMKQLYSTGVPMPFECVFACQVKDASEVEHALHLAFGMTRVNPNREFFRLEAERVVAVLRLLKIDDVTQEFEQSIEAEVPSADMQSAQVYKRSMRAPMNFHELGIPDGSILRSRDGSAECTVVGPKKVEFQGEASSLTAATRKMLGLAEDYPLQPSPYWTFHGHTVKELYEAFHSKSEDEA